MNMPRTKKQPEPTSLPPPGANSGAVAGEVLTLPEAAAYLRFPEADVLRLIDEQALPARRLGNEWRFSKAAIQQWLSTPAQKSNKEAWLALAGVWKDDPHVEEELKEIYKRRGRPMTEDE
jgi:excisionase family DNA binding protein